MHVIVWKDFSPSHLHPVLLRKCQQGEGTELFSYGAGRSWDWKTAISSSPTSPSQQNVKVHSLLWEDSSPQGLPQEKICSGVKIHTFSNCHWHFSTAAIMLLTWRWLFQVKEFASKQSLCSGSRKMESQYEREIRVVGLCLSHSPVNIWTTAQMQSRNKLGQLCSQGW